MEYLTNCFPIQKLFGGGPCRAYVDQERCLEKARHGAGTLQNRRPLDGAFGSRPVGPKRRTFMSTRWLRLASGSPRDIAVAEADGQVPNKSGTLGTISGDVF